MDLRQNLLTRLRTLRSKSKRLSGGQQALLVRLDKKCRTKTGGSYCCQECLEIMDGPGQHYCGKPAIYVQIEQIEPSPFRPYAWD